MAVTATQNKKLLPFVVRECNQDVMFKTSFLVLTLLAAGCLSQDAVSEENIANLNINQNPAIEPIKADVNIAEVPTDKSSENPNPTPQTPQDAKKKAPPVGLTQEQIDALADKILEIHGVETQADTPQNIARAQRLRNVVSNVETKLENKLKEVAENAVNDDLPDTKSTDGERNKNGDDGVELNKILGEIKNENVENTPEEVEIAQASQNVDADTEQNETDNELNVSEGTHQQKIVEVENISLEDLDEIKEAENADVPDDDNLNLSTNDESEKASQEDTDEADQEDTLKDVSDITEVENADVPDDGNLNLSTKDEEIEKASQEDISDTDETDKEDILKGEVNKSNSVDETEINEDRETESDVTTTEGEDKNEPEDETNVPSLQGSTEEGEHIDEVDGSESPTPTLTINEENETRRDNSENEVIDNAETNNIDDISPTPVFNEADVKEGIEKTQDISPAEELINEIDSETCNTDDSDCDKKERSHLYSIEDNLTPEESLESKTNNGYFNKILNFVYDRF